MTTRPMKKRSLRRRPIKQRRIATALVALFAAAALAACGSAQANGGDDPLKVGELGAIPLQEPLLEAAGQTPTDYSVQHSIYPAGPGLIEAVPSGQVDLGLMADTPPIFAQRAGVPIKIVAVNHIVKDGEPFAFLLVKGDSAARSTADLRGRKVAAAQGTILQYSLIRILERDGLTLDDIDYVNLPPQDAAAALTSGDVDAALVMDPDYTRLSSLGHRPVADTGDLVSGNTVWVATDAALADETKRAQIQDYIQRYQKARDWGTANEEAYIELYSRTSGLDLDLTRRFVARSGYTPVPIDEQVIAGQQQQSDVYTQLGLLPQQEVAAEYDTSLNDALTGATR